MDDDSHGRVNDAGRDRRVRDIEQFLHGRRTEALAMIRLWEKSPAPHAADELRYWRGVLRMIDRQAAKLIRDRPDTRP